MNKLKLWLNSINSQEVCSEHFQGGKKTYLNNVGTIVPETLKPKEIMKEKII